MAMVKLLYFSHINGYYLVYIQRCHNAGVAVRSRAEGCGQLVIVGLSHMQLTANNG